MKVLILFYCFKISKQIIIVNIMAKNKVDKPKIVNRLNKLTKSSENIKKMSAYMMQFNRYPTQIGEAWLEAMKKATDDQRKLTLIYVANEIVQTCKKHNAGEFRKVWKKVMPYAAAYLSGCSYYDKIKHIFEIWVQRGIYENAYMKHVLSKMGSAPEKQHVEHEPGISDDIDLKIIDGYKPEELFESLRQIDQLERDEAEVEQISYQLEKSARAEMSTVKGAHETRELSDKWCECANQWETLLRCANDQVKSRQKIKEILKKAEIFYQAQYKDASVVYKAYRNYGSRISQVKKRTSQQITALSSGLSSYTELVTSLDDDHEPTGDETPEYVGLESRIGRLCQQEGVSPHEEVHHSPPPTSQQTPTPPDEAANQENEDDQDHHPHLDAAAFCVGLAPPVPPVIAGVIPPPTPNIIPGLPPPPPPPPVPTSGIFPTYNSSANDSGSTQNYPGYHTQEIFPQYYMASNQHATMFAAQQPMATMFDPQANYYSHYAQFRNQQQLDDERQKTLEDEFIRRMNTGLDNPEKIKKESRSKKSKRKKTRRSSRSESREKDRRESEDNDEIENDDLSDLVDVKKSKHSKKHKRRSQSSHSNSPSETRSHKKSDRHKDRRSDSMSDCSSPRYHSTAATKKHSKYEDREDSPYYEKHRERTYKSSDKYREGESSYDERHRNKEKSSWYKHHDSKYEEEEHESRYDSQNEEEHYHHSKRSDHKKEKESKHSRHHSSSSREERKRNSSSHKDELSDQRAGRSSDHKRKVKKESPDSTDKMHSLQSVVSQPDRHRHEEADADNSPSTDSNRKHTNSGSEKRRYDDYNSYESRGSARYSSRGLHDSPRETDYASPYYESPGKKAKLDDTPEYNELDANDYEGGDTPTQDELRESGPPLVLPISQPPPYHPSSTRPPPNPRMFTCPPPGNTARFLPPAANLPAPVAHLPPGQVLRPPPPLPTQTSAAMSVSSISLTPMPALPTNQPDLTSNSPSKIAASWSAWRQSRPVPSLPSLNPTNSVPSQDPSVNLSPRVPLIRHNSGPSPVQQQHPISSDSGGHLYLTGGEVNARPNQPIPAESVFSHRPVPPNNSPRIRFNLRLGGPIPHGARPFSSPRFRGERPRVPLPYFPNQSKTFRPRDPSQHFLK